MNYVFEPQPRPSVAIAGETARFPVRRIFCVGRNYAKHALEMGHDPQRDPPFFFTKPADAVVDAGVERDAQIPYPPLTTEFHHEIELAVAIDRGGCDISVEQAHDHVFGYATSLDLTRRDLQREAKAKGHPWDASKAFDYSAPIAALQRVAEVGHPQAGRIWLEVDGEVRQDADLSELIWPAADVISMLSRAFTLAPGDLILTGTPAGVGPLAVGQRVRGGIEGLADIEITVTAR